MTRSLIQTSFIGGEISPSLFGRTDFQKWHNGASTMRNFYADYRGGASSRAGLRYIGMCKQGAPNGGGTGTSYPPRDIPFQFSINQGYVLEFGDQYMRVKYDGAYVVEAAVTVTSVSTAGLFTTSSAHGYSVGDWVYDIGNSGFNGLTWVVATVPSSTTLTVTDLFGTAITTATASTGGSLERIYTVVAPYAAVDLPYLKYAQSADTMSLCCVNQATSTEYIPYDLARVTNTNWTFTALTFATSILPPTNVTATAQSSTTVTTYYAYVVTAISAATGEESVASTVANVDNNDIAVYAGSNLISWQPVAGASNYNVYKATPSYGTANTVPVGTAFGYIGTAFGSNFLDTNITADFTQVPPINNNPFARGKITQVNITASGSGYTQGTVGYTVTTSTGTGFVGTPVVVGGAVTAFIITNGGSGYANTDTITITGGTGATATLTVGPQTGTYPGVVAYYQQRRFYANTLNNPDTYYASQPGAFKNFDTSIPTVDSDAIIGTPWAQQVNGIQFMQPMTGGLIILTGNGAWNLSGGSNAAITPADEDAQAQAYNGCNATVQPIVINYDILYVQSKGSIVRDLAYNFFVNIFTGTDKTILANHLFDYHQIKQWSYAEEPYKNIWAVRSDGTMLSFTYLKEQDVYAWARHDTDGLFVGVTTITEPPVDAVYTIVQRYIRGNWVYYAERMDNRNWVGPEDCFCVDAGLNYPMTYPSATLYPSAATGTNNISSVTVTFGGTGYTAPVASAVDPTGQGSGATFTVTASAGVITGITVTAQGANYQPGTKIVISDTTGKGALAVPVITNNVTFTASSSVFTSGMVGDVIRIGNVNAAPVLTGVSTGGTGKAIITGYTSGTQVTANIIEPITTVLSNDPNSQPIPVLSGQWSIGVPTSTVTGLNHLEGKTVAIVGDGSVQPSQVVTNGVVSLPIACSAITIGLPYTCQLQTLYLEPPGPETAQDKRKSVQSLYIRVKSSRGLQAGSNQVDQSTQPYAGPPVWNSSTGMKEFKDKSNSVFTGNALPLLTGDLYINIPNDQDTPGQAAVQQIYPMPAQVSAIVNRYEMGDTAT